MGWEGDGDWNISYYFKNYISGNAASFNFTFICGALLFLVWWIPGMWYTAMIGGLAGTAALYSYCRISVTTRRMANNEGNLIEPYEWAETIGLGICVAWPLLIWAGTEFFGRIFGMGNIWGSVGFP